MLAVLSDRNSAIIGELAKEAGTTPDEVIGGIVELYLQGQIRQDKPKKVLVEKIMTAVEEYNSTQKSLKTRLKQTLIGSNGTSEVKPQRKYNIDLQEVASLRSQGKSIRQIADHFGMSKSGMARQIKKLDKSADPS